jgi:hypothetical protein
LGKNAGMPENNIYVFMMDYEYQEKKKEINKLKNIVFEIYIYLLDFKKYFLSVNTNSGEVWSGPFTCATALKNGLTMYSIT